MAIIDCKGLPSNLDAERLVLGSVLSRYSGFDLIASSLSVDDFSLMKHQTIFRRMTELYQRGENIDRVTIADELERLGELEACDGLSYLVGLDDGLPQFPSLDSYCRILRDKAILRRLVAFCDATINDVMSNGDAAAVERAEGILASLVDSRKHRVSLMSPAEIKLNAPGGIEGFMEPSSLPRRSIPTPWRQLNNILACSGLRPGQLVILAARTGVGKSVAAAQIAHYDAQCGFGSAIFSLEMSREEILVRMTCARASVNSHRFQSGYLNRDEFAAFRRASTEIDELPLLIDDTTGCTVPAIHAAVRKQRATGAAIAVVIVDYLQLLESTGRNENRASAVAEISRGLKRMARELDVPVLALCQLSRAAVHDGGRPQLHHLRESGSIEQDADLVIFLHQPHFDEQPLGIQSSPVEIEVVVAKQRNGPTGIVNLIFERGLTRFNDPSGALPEEM